MKDPNRKNVRNMKYINRRGGFIEADSKTFWRDWSSHSQSGSSIPALSKIHDYDPNTALHTCPLSKFSFSSSRLFAAPVRRITLGIALGTCCMELFTRSIVVRFLQPRNYKRNKIHVPSITRLDCEQIKIKWAQTMAGSSPCWAGLYVPFSRPFCLPVNDSPDSTR